MRLFWGFLGIVALVATGSFASPSEQKRFDGYKVLRVIPRSGPASQTLQSLQDVEGISFWEGPSPVGRPSDIMVSPEMEGHLMRTITSLEMDVSEHIPDVQKLIDQETLENDLEAQSSASTEFKFNVYHRYQEIQNFIESQAKAHPDIASIITIGQTFEKRNYTLIKLSKPSNESKPIIFVEANIHAREWITSAVTVYTINAMLNGRDQGVKAWLDDFDFYILPVSNPDGLEFSKDKDRLWRKTRSTVPNKTCKGTDPNRNWGFKWKSGGSSSNPCSDLYAGPSAFSEPETKAMSNFLWSLRGKVFALISVHSYSQLILQPYGVKLPFPKKSKYMAIGKEVAGAIKKRFGTVFTPGNIVDLLYVASGSNLDWAEGVLGVKYSTCFELRDKGKYKFILPPSQIIPSSLELIDGFKVLFKELSKMKKNP